MVGATFVCMLRATASSPAVLPEDIHPIDGYSSAYYSQPMRGRTRQSQEYSAVQLTERGYADGQDAET